MIADPDMKLVMAHADQLTRLGYGYSLVEIGDSIDEESAHELLRDWGWSQLLICPDG